jgi:hypothetical protein
MELINQINKNQLFTLKTTRKGTIDEHKISCISLNQDSQRKVEWSNIVQTPTYQEYELYLNYEGNMLYLCASKPNDKKIFLHCLIKKTGYEY